MRRCRAFGSAVVVAGMLALAPVTASAQASPPDAPSASAPPPIDFGEGDIRDIRGPIELPDPWWVRY
nr:hypothetical protein [Myxococcota bacterium]